MTRRGWGVGEDGCVVSFVDVDWEIGVGLGELVGQLFGKGVIDRVP